MENELWGIAHEDSIDTISIDANFDILRRPSRNIDDVKLSKSDRKWLKVNKVK